MKEMSPRQFKVGELVRRELAFEVLSIGAFERFGFVTIVKAFPTADLKMCKIYFRTKYEKVDEILDVFKTNKVHLQNFLFKKLGLKNKIDLKFYYDDGIEESEKINHLIDQIHKKMGRMTRFELATPSATN